MTYSSKIGPDYPELNEQQIHTLIFHALNDTGTKDWTHARQNGTAWQIAYAAIKYAFIAGADAELKECMKEINDMNMVYTASDLEEKRRNKPKSIKEQSLNALQESWSNGFINHKQFESIQSALNFLPD